MNDDKGQTTFDYLVGILLVITAASGALWLFPQMFDPFYDPVTSDHEEMADRFAAEILETNGTMANTRTLDLRNGTLDEDNVTAIRDRSGIPGHRTVNVTLQRDDTIHESYGPPRRSGKPVAMSFRTIQTVDGSGLNCSGSCRLIVQVW